MSLLYPVDRDHRVSQRFQHAGHPDHDGVDFAVPADIAPPNAPRSRSGRWAGVAGRVVVAAHEGTVSTYNASNGGVVRLRGARYTTVYRHVTALRHSGTVAPGTPIAVVGPGRFPHLHFEVYDHGILIDPQTVLTRRRTAPVFLYLAFAATAAIAAYIFLE